LPRSTNAATETSLSQFRGRRCNTAAQMRRLAGREAGHPCAIEASRGRASLESYARIGMVFGL
jgi:hypothetical protein